MQCGHVDFGGRDDDEDFKEVFCGLRSTTPPCRPSVAINISLYGGGVFKLVRAFSDTSPTKTGSLLLVPWHVGLLQARKQQKHCLVPAEAMPQGLSPPTASIEPPGRPANERPLGWVLPPPSLQAHPMRARGEGPSPTPNADV